MGKIVLALVLSVGLTACGSDQPFSRGPKFNGKPNGGSPITKPEGLDRDFYVNTVAPMLEKKENCAR